MAIIGSKPESAPMSASTQSPSELSGERSIEELMEHLLGLSINVQAKDGKLRLDAPTGVLTAELQSELRLRKAEILTYLEAEVLADEEVAPLTFAQQRLWLIERFTPGTIAYNVPQSWRVPSEIDLTVFRQALRVLAERHGALRTRIEVRNGEPVQVILKQVEIPVAVTDLSPERDRERRESQLEKLLIEEGKRIIPFSHAPMIRFLVIRLTPDETVIFFSVHHILVDQWSLDLMKRDLFLLYEEQASGKPSDLSPLSVQYADIARRERSEIAERIHLNKLAYWRDRLANMPMLLELPFSKTRPAQQNYIGKTLSRTMDRELTDSLRQFASRNSASLYLLMLTMFSTLVYRYTGQKDFCIGTPTSGRKQRDEEDIIGLFVNMVPVRCLLDPEESFGSLLEGMKSHVLSDLDHGDVPFQRLVSDLQVSRSPSSSPIFQISFALNPKRPGDSSKSDLQHETFIGISKFDLMLQIAEQVETLDAHFEYGSDLFAESDIEDFAMHFIHLCKLIVEEPSRAIARLPLLTSADSARILEFNKTGFDFDRSQTLSSLFTRQVLTSPSNAALCCNEVVWSYQELEDRVAHLTGKLQRLGVKKQEFVGICMERSPYMIVSILAVLKAGAAYLPMDPKYPLDRLSYMLEDSGAKVLIATNSEFAKRLVNQPSGLTVVDPAQSKLEQVPTQFAAPDPQSAAYLIYTSGSTGKPKGVVVEHRNTVALIEWAKNQFDPSSIRGILASTSVCFDLSVFEIFLPLLTGNCIILVDDILALPKCAHSERVTLINTVPSAMWALLQSGLPSNIQTVCMAGEFLPSELVDRVYAAGVAQVIDLYGPTETTTYSTFAVRVPQTGATIGRPIANTRIYLVDDNLELVPPGLPGEVFIGGEGVARGYLNRPELSSERFVSLPQIEKGSRLYRTGDLARQREDGSLIYLGRRDQQIKLRGHRIELGEIESALREIHGISQAVVVVQKGATGDSLAAFIVHRQTEPVDPAVCRTTLNAKLPAYMVPAVISAIPEMPLTPNGKVDRKVLEQWNENQAPRSDEPPINLLEQWLANIWSYRLGRDNVARDAHFFDDLGGHSLAAFEIFTEIEQRMGTALMLAVLFQAPTIELLSEVIQRHGWKQPMSLRFLKSGPREPVSYLLDEGAEQAAVSLGFAPNRLMVVDSLSLKQNTNKVADEIASYESKDTSLSLRTTTVNQGQARALVRALNARGFNQVSVDSLAD